MTTNKDCDTGFALERHTRLARGVRDNWQVGVVLGVKSVSTVCKAGFEVSSTAYNAACPRSVWVDV